MKPFYIIVGLDPPVATAMIDKLKKSDAVVSLDLALPPRKAKSNGLDTGMGTNGSAPRQRGSYEATGQETIAKILNGKPPMTTPQLRDAFAAAGRSPHSIASCIDTMKKAGEVTKGPQGYTLTKKMRDRLRHSKGAKSKK